MDFSLTDEQKMLCETLTELGRDLNEDLVERDHAGSFSHQSWKACGEVGVQGLPIPEAYGGAGADVVTTAVALESFGAACRDEGLTFSICAHMQSCAIPVWEYGSEEQKKRFLPGLVSGELIGGNATTEPESGSDAFAMKTTAVADGDEYVLNGSKTFVTNGPVADVILVYALTNPEYRQFGGISGFLVEKGTPGFEVGSHMEKIGLRTSPWCEVGLQDCRVPASHRLGHEGSGAAMFGSSMDWERLLVSMTYVGRMQDTLERTIEYARTRRQFGQQIGKHQAVADKIVEMKAHLEASRLLLYRAAWEKQTQGRGTQLAICLGKWFATEHRLRSALHAIQIHGGYGCASELGIERELRNAVPGSIASGTSEIQKVVIARHLGL
jgi:alkylation response protein AidB-like acyl-CoA dehydrogenase